MVLVSLVVLVPRGSVPSCVLASTTWYWSCVVCREVAVAAGAHVIELFIMDAFVDLFITLCIVANTVFMALDHANMDETLMLTLKYGNYVRPHGQYPQ